MDEVNLRTIRDRYSYLTELEQTRAKYIHTVEEYCKLKPELLTKFPAIKAQFLSAETKQQLEDLYLPYKPKRRTRAQIAKEKGLEGLLDLILAGRATITNLSDVASEFVTPAGKEVDKALLVASTAEALAGAADIFAERISETAEFRSKVRDLSFQTGYLVSKKMELVKGEEIPKTLSKYETYFDYRESINTAPSHRVMAVRRGEAEKCLRVTIEIDEPRIKSTLLTLVLGPERTTPEVSQWMESISGDSYTRLLSTSIETEIRMHLKTAAETEAIHVFAKNLENLLLLPPIPGKTVLGVDPGIRTGSKLAVIDQTGKLLAFETVYPIPGKEDHPKSIEAKAIIGAIIKKHNVECIAIGNGTGSREIDQLIISVLRENSLKDVKRLVVNEAGASVYSTDEIAREEFPDLDPTIRSAVSIGRRLQDPLAELVKIDPRSIGVGQYQHDCNVTKLGRSLGETVESAVNKVGVNSKEAQGGRVSLLVTPTRNLVIKLSALSQTNESDGNSRIVYNYATKQPVAGELDYTLLSIEEPRKGQRDVYAASIEYDLGWAKLSSITSTQKSSDSLTTDFGSLAGAFGLDSAKSDSTEKGRKSSQEFRLVSQTAGTFEWLAGLYFDKNKLKRYTVRM
jgi:uncharacterized protein